MRRWYPIALVLAALSASLFVWDRLPARMPIHWNLAGEVDGYGSRLAGAFGLPALMLLLAVLVPVLPKIDPRGRNYDKFAGSYHLVMNAVLTFTFGIHVMLLATALGVAVPVARVVPVAVGALLVLLGNVLPRTRSNWMFGIRTPWTLSSERVWARTHRVGGWLMLGAGLLVMLAGLVGPPRLAGLMIGVAVTGAALATVAYSYVAWRQEGQP